MKRTKKESQDHVGKVLVSDVNRILLKLQIRDQEVEIIMLKEKLEEEIRKNYEMSLKIQKLDKELNDKPFPW